MDDTEFIAVLDKKRQELEEERHKLIPIVVQYKKLGRQFVLVQQIRQLFTDE